MDMTQYVAKIEGSDGEKGLGVVAGDFILTCAHYYDVFKADRFLMQSYSVELPRGAGKSEYWVVTVDPVMDFMVLGMQPLNHKIEGDACVSLEDFDPAITPVRIEFAGDLTGARVRGYFYSPDGVTRNDVEFNLRKGVHAFHLSPPIGWPGCSGGPVFTSDDQLVGIMQGLFNAQGKILDAVACRIDLAATGWLAQRYNGFAPFVISEAGGCVLQVA